MWGGRLEKVKMLQPDRKGRSYVMKTSGNVQLATHDNKTHACTQEMENSRRTTKLLTGEAGEDFRDSGKRADGASANASGHKIRRVFSRGK